MLLRLIILSAIIAIFAFGFAELVNYASDRSASEACGEWSNPDCPATSPPPAQ